MTHPTTSPDVQALEAALASRQWDMHVDADGSFAANPARLRRILDTMAKQQRDCEALENALDDMVTRFEPHAWGSADDRRDALASARAALAAYRGEA